MGIFSFILLLALGSFIYIYFNKEYIIHQITKAINDEVNGEIKTEDISFDIFKYFPATSVQLKEFSIRDSMYASHKMELLHAENVFVRINFKDLFSSHISIEQITLENGSIYLFTDTSGYSNKYLFKNKPDSASPKFKTGLNKLIFRDFRFVYRDQKKDKFFNVFFQKIKCDFEKTNSLLTADLDMEGKIKFLGFNTAKGFFASNTNVGSRLTINYFPAKNKLIIPASVIYLNDKSFDIKADFDLGDKPEFSFDIGSSRVLFSDVTEMVTAKIKNKLVNYKIINPVALQVHIAGPLQYRVIPEIAVKLTVKSNKVFYKETEFSKAGFDVSFTNVLDSLLPASDENSKIEILNFKADWEGISWISDTIQVVNLKNPKLTSVVTSAFSLREVNRLSGSQLFNFSKGTGNIKMSIVAFPDKENLNSTVNGEISIKDGSAVYGPRSMPFNNINSYIRIQDKDVFIDQLSCITGVSKLSLKGEAPGLIDYLSNKRKDANLKWTIKSPYINLNDLTAFLSKRKSVSHIKTKSRPKFFSEGSKLDNFLDQCSLDMKVDVTQLVFDNFSAKNITGHVVMIKNEYFVKNLHLNHADGDISLNGSISGTEFDQHRVHAEAILKNVNISKTFASFDNFSQTAVTDKNIEGIVQANAVLDFEMNQKAVIRQSSLEGAVDLTITDGEIKGFQPLGKLSDFLFPNRNFTEIKFSELTNLFTVKGDELFFERMKINSSVMEMYVEGSYFLSGKTDMNIQIPLANLKKRNWEEISKDITDKGEKGMNVFIHATTDEKGELKFKYDPLKKIKDKGNSTNFKKFLGKFKKQNQQ